MIGQNINSTAFIDKRTHWQSSCRCTIEPSRSSKLVLEALKQKKWRGYGLYVRDMIKKMHEHHTSLMIWGKNDTWRNGDSGLSPHRWSPEHKWLQWHLFTKLSRVFSWSYRILFSSQISVFTEIPQLCHFSPRLWSALDSGKLLPKLHKEMESVKTRILKDM